MKIIDSLTLLLGVCIPGLAMAQAGTTLLVRADVSCQWKLDGQVMGVLAADEARVVLVAPGEHLIEASSTVGTATFRSKVEVDAVEKTVNVTLQDQDSVRSNKQAGETARGGAGTAAVSTWTDPATGLMWNGKDNGSDVGWREATAYCAKLRLAGYRDWRLPTIEELQAIYDSGHSHQVKFGNGVTYPVHVKGDLKLTGWSWSSTQGEGAGQPWQQARLLNFGDEPESIYRLEGRHDHNFLGFDYTMRALCVRRAGE